MITHAKEFRLLADVKMISQILLIGSFIQPIDEILQQFAGTIGRNLMADMNSSFAKEFSAMIRGVEHKGEVIQTEGFLIVVTGNKIVRVELLHS